MFYVVAKLLQSLERPVELLLLLLLAGAVMMRFERFRRRGIALVTWVAIVFLAIAILPVSHWLLAPLENRFPRAASPLHVDGIIVLGGAVNPTATRSRGIPSLNLYAERMTEFVRLAKLHPEARLVFSGGAATYEVDPNDTEAGVARLFFRQQGLDVGRVLFEARSRDTYENILFTKALVQPRPGEVWLLVASAMDVPRDVGVFRKQGWPVTPVPVAYKSDGGWGTSVADKLGLLDDGMHEWLGLAAYRLAGRTDALFPAP